MCLPPPQATTFTITTHHPSTTFSAATHPSILPPTKQNVPPFIFLPAIRCILAPILGGGRLAADLESSTNENATERKSDPSVQRERERGRDRQREHIFQSAQFSIEKEVISKQNKVATLSDGNAKFGNIIKTCQFLSVLPLVSSALPGSDKKPGGKGGGGS